MRRKLASLVLVLACCATASGAESAKQHVTVHMEGGRPVTGVVLAQDVWEKQDAKGAWLPAKKDEPGAGVRVWYVGGLDGFVFVTATKITDLKFEGEYADAEARKFKEGKDAAQAKSDADRKRLADEKAQRAADAKGDGGKGTNAKGDPQKGDAGKGDAAKGDGGKGDAAKGDGGKGDAAKGDAGKGDAAKGDAGKGTNAKGDPQKGDAGKGTNAKGDPQKGDAGKGTNAKGDPQKGDAGKGDAAKGGHAETEPPKTPTPPEPSNALSKRTQDLLTKYPPGKWKLSTPDDVQQRFIVSHLPATEEELAFIAVFEEWKVAYDAWLLLNPK